MNNKQWQYKIGGGVGCGTVLLFFMTIGMAALCLWFQKTGNGAILLGRIILTIFSAVLVLSIYRSIFFKVLIGEDSFFYQSSPGNGRYYRYSEIRNAWISSGRETNGTNAQYCQIETRAGATIRIPITGIDTDAAEYLVDRVANVSASDATGMEDDLRDHTISGKVQGITRIVVLCLIIGVVLWLSYSLAKEGLPPITYAFSFIASICALVYLITHYLFYRIDIRRDGFYCRTNPFNGQFYKYRDIANCKVIEKRRVTGSVRNGGRRSHYLHYLIFTDKSGKEHRIRYDKGLFEREINILASRINQSKS